MQSLFHQVNVSDPSNFNRAGALVLKAVAIPFSSGQSFRLVVDGMKYHSQASMSQSLFHQVNVSDEGQTLAGQSHYPGWHDFINKKAVTIYHTNYLFQGINLQKGNYVVSFEYKPGLFFTGLKISIILFLVMFITCVSISLNCHHFRSNQKSE